MIESRFVMQKIYRRRTTLEEALGSQVRLMRRMRNLSVAALADAAGISIGMLSKIENGKTSPSLKTIRALAAALETRLTSLFASFEDDAPEPTCDLRQGRDPD